MSHNCRWSLASRRDRVQVARDLILDGMRGWVRDFWGLLGDRYD